MHAMISVTYSADGVIKKLSAEKYGRLHDGFPTMDLPMPQPADDEAWKESKWNVWNIRDVVIDLTTTGKLLTELEIPFEVKKFKNTYRMDAPDQHHHLHIAIPNIGTLMIDEVQVEEDCCTDRLQDKLNEGWRIIAVCPPNAQRRPDYVLGRTPETRGEKK